MSKKSKKQEETEEYLSKIKLKEIFQVNRVLCKNKEIIIYFAKFVLVILYIVLQGLLTHVMLHQPEDPISYIHGEITKIKKEVDESKVPYNIHSNYIDSPFHPPNPSHTPRLILPLPHFSQAHSQQQKCPKRTKIDFFSLIFTS